MSLSTYSNQSLYLIVSSSSGNLLGFQSEIDLETELVTDSLLAICKHNFCLH